MEGVPDRIESATESEVMAALDDSEGITRYVIADVATDDAWLSIVASEAPVLANWR
jgi:hypothetical protein